MGAVGLGRVGGGGEGLFTGLYWAVNRTMGWEKSVQIRTQSIVRFNSGVSSVRDVVRLNRSPL